MDAPEMDADTVALLRRRGRDDQRHAAIDDYLATDDEAGRRVALARLLGHLPDEHEWRRVEAIRCAATPGAGGEARAPMVDRPCAPTDRPLSRRELLTPRRWTDRWGHREAAARWLAGRRR